MFNAYVVAKEAMVRAACFAARRGREEDEAAQRDRVQSSRRCLKKKRKWRLISELVHIWGCQILELQGIPAQGLQVRDALLERLNAYQLAGLGSHLRGNSSEM